MSHPRKVWIVFAAALVVVVAAMAFLSAVAVRLDNDRIATKRQAELEESVRLSLWRMDGALTALVSQESTRPVFEVGVQTEITSFVLGSPPSPIEFQAVLDAGATSVIYRPTGLDVLSSHLLEAGVYTIAFEGLNGLADEQDLRLEVETTFLPPESVTAQ